MQAIELPSEYHVAIKQNRDAFCCNGFIVDKYGSRKQIRSKHNIKISSGVLMIAIFQNSLNLLVVIGREGPYMLSLNLFNTLTDKLAKRTIIPILHNSFNFKRILRLHFEAKRIIFYLESQATIEIRNSSSLKPVSTFRLAQICNELNMSDRFSELKASVDLDYIPHLSSIVMILDSQVVMIEGKNAKASPMVIFDSKHEKFKSLRCNTKQRALLVEGNSSLVLLGLNEVGEASYTKVFTSNYLGKAGKLLCWNPFEEIVVVTQRIALSRENFHVLSYKTETISVAASVLNVPTYGNYYEEHSQTLIYVEGNEDQQIISYLSLKDFNKNVVSGATPAILEGQCMAYLPSTDHPHNAFHLINFRGLLFVGPCYSSNSSFKRL